ncbi:MAG TPA: iron-containing redox enzyme family protein [Gemmatimonadaceae bacterium]|nr:iron-containing redox enzyme family protein [Gemmatimonadaceae bacterium]
MKLQLSVDEYAAAARAFWTQRRLAELLPDYLFCIHTIIRASVPLMEAACDKARGLSARDPVAASLAAYLGHHVPEERHHDDWLLDDLAELGVSREEVLRKVPSPTVAMLVGAQYYWIHHYHPVALLGYIAVLEGYPPEEDHILSVIERTGLTPRAFRTFLKHARLDPHHRDDLDAALDSMALTKGHESLVAMSALETQHLLAVLLREVVRDHSSRESKRLA